MIKAYYELAKPGIIYGNAITAVGAYFLAARGHGNIGTFLAMLLGISLVIGSACVCNNFLDRDIDKKMQRTKKRALVTHAISGPQSLLFAAVLGILGLLLLGVYNNFLTATVALFGFLMYVAVYTPIKRLSVYGTLVGSISGAVPPIVGYCAATNRLDLGAGILFLILVFWQMPHFYAIAMYRLHDYTEANIPVLPIVSGMRVTKIHIVSYIAALLVAVIGLTLTHFAGYTVAIVLVGITVFWLLKGIKGLTSSSIQDATWARGMFFFSLIVILVLCGMLSLNSFLI